MGPLVTGHTAMNIGYMAISYMAIGYGHGLLATCYW
jgi:hypothetical protein